MKFTPQIGYNENEMSAKPLRNVRECFRRYWGYYVGLWAAWLIFFGFGLLGIPHVGFVVVFLAALPSMIPRGRGKIELGAAYVLAAGVRFACGAPECLLFAFVGYCLGR